VNDSREEKLLLAHENQRLREENEKLKKENQRLAGQSQDLTVRCSKQKTAMDALKQELEKSLQLYEECRTELRDMVDQLGASQVQIDTRDALIDKLKKKKAELEKTLEDNESYYHQWGVHLAHTYRRVLERYGAETQTFRVTDNIARYYTWMNDELKVLSDSMSKVGDYRAVTSSETIF
jgi:chromosome segregation ATPase